LSLAGGDTAVTIKAAAQQTSGVNAAMAYGTDGPVAALGLQTLSDPKGVQPIYAPAPVVRESVLKDYPQMGEWLQPVFASLDEKTLQQLNASIAVEGWMRKSRSRLPEAKRMGEVTAFAAGGCFVEYFSQSGAVAAGASYFRGGSAAFH
jgi:hypothetical protein